MSNVTTDQRSPEETLALYERGAKNLEALLAGLSEADLDLTRVPGEWSIRQIVHHIAEGDALFMVPIKSALAQSGSTFVRNALDPDPDAGPVALGLASRPVESSVTLTKAIREQLSQLIRYVPDSWGHYVMMKSPEGDDGGRRMDVGLLVGIMVSHMAEHCDEIKTIREVHGR